MKEILFKKFCRISDELLLDKNATKATIAIRSLHIIKNHPDYLYTTNNKSFFRILKYLVANFFFALLYNLRFRLNKKNIKFQNKSTILISHLVNKDFIYKKNDFYYGNLQQLFKKKKLPTHVFRLPGIYGPGRSVLDRILNGNNSVIRLKNHFFSRVHVEDIASAINKSMTIRTPGQIYNLTDNFPCSAHDVHEYASKLLKTQLPRYLDISSSNLNERVKDFYKDNKRVSNQKIKKILDWTPKFENYKLGLNNIFESLNG